MSDHFIGANRGNVGFADNQFTYGTSTGSTDIELRIADAPDAKLWTRLEIVEFLEAVEAFLTAPNPAIAGTLFPII